MYVIEAIFYKDKHLSSSLYIALVNTHSIDVKLVLIGQYSK